MEVTDLYNKLCLYFGESTKYKILNISINKNPNISDKPAFTFLYKYIFYTITAGMNWQITDEILIDLYNELTTLLRNRIINDVLDEK